MRLIIPSHRKTYCLALLLLFLLTACTTQPPIPTPPPTPIPTPLPQPLNLGLTPHASWLAANLPAVSPVPLSLTTAPVTTLWTDLTHGRYDAILVHQIPPNSPNWFNPIALDALVIIVHLDNPLTSLTRPQAQALFSGRQSPADLGGPQTEFNLIVQPPASPATTLWQARLLRQFPLALSAPLALTPADLFATVAADPLAISYAFYGHLPATVTPLALDNIPPTSATLADQSYPLTIPLYFVLPTAAEPTATTRHLLSWLQSPAGQNFIGEKYGRVR